MYPSDEAFMAFLSTLRINTNHSAPGNRFQAVVRSTLRDSSTSDPVLHTIAEKMEISEATMLAMKLMRGASEKH